MFFRMTILIIENTNLVTVFKRFNYFFVIHAGFEGHIAEKERKQGSFKKKMKINVSVMVIAYTFITCINHHPRNCPVYIYNFDNMNRIIVKK